MSATVVVVTGASSGIGRATALRLARRHPVRLVLAARSAESLEAVAAACRSHGASGITVPTDVSDEAQVDRLAARAMERYGRIDAWISAASVMAYGSADQLPTETFRRVIDVNLFGQLHGARAAIAAFRSQDERPRGRIVIVGSLFSKITAPTVGAYAASKHATLALAETLRLELLGSAINVSTVLPATIDTPIYQHAADATGHEPHPIPPVVAPERVAAAIERVLHAPRRTVIVGRTQASLIPLRAALPAVYDRLTRMAMRRIALRGDPSPNREGNLSRPKPASNATSGGWGRFGRRGPRRDR